ncbi:MAG: hypothetical protein IT184_14895 [Acidobacteria bacterium]|nr:hypothetical protein [Acidobacteriota bacterium]
MFAAKRHWIARVALFVLLGTFSSPLFAAMHLASGDDPACDPSGLGPRHASSQFEAAQPPPASGHCDVCHWIRVVTHRRAAGPPRMDVPRAAELVAPAPYQTWIGQPLLSPRASRAPPVVSL